MTISDVVPVGSDCCGLDDLFLDCETAAARDGLGLGPGWPRRWTAGWRTPDGEVACAVRDLGEVPAAGWVPVRRFTWRQRQRHRPGLQFLVSTGRLHGFESLEERSLLLALDFTGTVQEVLSQPFRLKFETAGGGPGEHIPDFLAVFRDGSRWLLDVRPARLVKREDAVRFAAAAEAALEAGWRYSVVAGWRPHVLSVLDALSAQRREMEDPLGLEGELFRAVSGGPAAFGDLVTATRLPAVARAHARHLLWHRRLGTDLARPLGDRSPV
ncbi:MAG: TnsA-like heteromeric transposase endonuclease subunit, partial [Trebonia sp.]